MYIYTRIYIVQAVSGSLYAKQRWFVVSTVNLCNTTPKPPTPRNLIVHTPAHYIILYAVCQPGRRFPNSVKPQARALDRIIHFARSARVAIILRTKFETRASASIRLHRQQGFSVYIVARPLLLSARAGTQLNAPRAHHYCELGFSGYICFARQRSALPPHLKLKKSTLCAAALCSVGGKRSI